MEVAGADSGRVGLLVATALTLPYVLENRETAGRFLILGATWLFVFGAQGLFYVAMILENITARSLLPFFALALLLITAGASLIMIRRKTDISGQMSGSVRWKHGLIIMLAVIICGIAGVEALGRTESAGIIYELRELIHGRPRDSFGTNRLYIWRHALRAFTNRPVIGSGPDTFELVFPADAQGFYMENYEKAHNEYIQILVCQGILGLLAYLIFLCDILRKVISKAFRDPILMAVTAAFIGYAAQAVFNISAPIASQMLWVFAGMMANEKLREEAEETMTL
jgi:hypothetical protein